MNGERVSVCRIMKRNLLIIFIIRTASVCTFFIVVTIYFNGERVAVCRIMNRNVPVLFVIRTASDCTVFFSGKFPFSHKKIKLSSSPSYVCMFIV